MPTDKYQTNKSPPHRLKHKKLLGGLPAKSLKQEVHKVGLFFNKLSFGNG